LSSKVAEKKIEVRCSSPVKRLIATKGEGVTGVRAVIDGEEVEVRARRGVVLSCGGFEYETSMHLGYLGQHYFGLGHPENTGDGLRMAADIGADFWHMNAVASTFGYKVPEFEFAMMHLMPAAGFIYVDQNANRYMDEAGTDPHFTWATTAEIDPKTLQRLRMPTYVIFDEDTRMRGAIAALGHGKASDVYQWSRDNSAEIGKGWIKAAETIGELANRINLRPDQLQATVAKYNLQCVGGYDPDHGRVPDTLVPLGRPPYYAIEIWPCLFNTQGGPRKNARAQIMDVWGNPIKRLYGAGELGSIWHRNYPGAGNISEALAFGRIAGRNAGSEIPAVA
jgi:succinate dehydrogenase/fumarate reductase flavoprotein subunit